MWETEIQVCAIPRDTGFWETQNVFEMRLSQNLCILEKIFQTRNVEDISIYNLSHWGNAVRVEIRTVDGAKVPKNVFFRFFVNKKLFFRNTINVKVVPHEIPSTFI